MGKLGLREVKNVLYLAESGRDSFPVEPRLLLCPSALKYVQLFGVTVGCKAELIPTPVEFSRSWIPLVSREDLVLSYPHPHPGHDLKVLDLGQADQCLARSGLPGPRAVFLVESRTSGLPE